MTNVRQTHTNTGETKKATGLNKWICKSLMNTKICGVCVGGNGQVVTEWKMEKNASTHKLMHPNEWK